MTTPTQAQVEAAKQLVNQLDQLLMQNKYNEAEFVVARTFAAREVAAQVGEQYRQEANAAIDTGIRIATIERCAQVAEQPRIQDAMAGEIAVSVDAREIATAIRKLKDEAHTAA